MKQMFIDLLTSLSHKIVAKYQPQVIGVTGSYGKTSVRKAIYVVLKEAGYSVRTPEKSYNNEIGFPLAILGVESPGNSSIGWLGVLFKSMKLAYGGRDVSFPKYLVLEYGADKKGDIKHLASIAAPQISVITGVSSIHSEGIGSLEEIIKEKGTLAKITPVDGMVFVNVDDKNMQNLLRGVRAPITSYGFGTRSDVTISEFKLETWPDDGFSIGEHFAVISFLVSGEKNTYQFTISNALGRPVATTISAATAVAEYLKIDSDIIVQALSGLEPEKGRMNPLPGIKGSLVLDDSYNASPAAVNAALDTLSEFDPVEGARRIAVLGSMKELGKYSEDEHRHVGFKVAELGIDLLVCVAEEARDIARSAIEAGMSKDSVMEFMSSEEAGRWLDPQIRKGDIVLVKGSQSIRTDKIVKEIMAEPERASELLVRQYGGWLKS